jgi:enamine deaminase RidA (YjgF/YER057c/UK114 family)
VQTTRMFEAAQGLLRGIGTDYRSVARTWLYVSDILSWYGKLNGARSACYRRFGLMPAAGSRAILLPASTGIEGRAPSGAAVTMDLLATVLEPGSRIEVGQMTNPRQKDAFAYGSAFSRGAAIRMPDATWISFSGTAAIDEAGLSCHPGDFRAQMHMTLDVVEALLAQEGAGLADICNATLFLKHAACAAECRRVLRERGLEDLPGVPVVADVCREELLFEMDGTAAVLK